jgi:hypothetical protein
MHIGSVGIFGGPAPGPHEMAEAVARDSAVRAPRTGTLSQKGIDQRTLDGRLRRLTAQRSTNIARGGCGPLVLVRGGEVAAGPKRAPS